MFYNSLLIPFQVLFPKTGCWITVTTRWRVPRTKTGDPMCSTSTRHSKYQTPTRDKETKRQKTDSKDKRDLSFCVLCFCL